MSRPPRTHHFIHRLRREATTYRHQIDYAARQTLGVSGVAYRAFDKLYNLIVGGIVVYLVAAHGLHPILGVVFAGVMVGISERMERVLIRYADVVAPPFPEEDDDDRGPRRGSDD